MTFAALFLAHSQQAGDRGLAVSDALLAAFEATLAAARAAWPDVPLADDRFVLHLARHRSDETPLETWLARVRASDLYLACACYENCSGAIAAFERVFMPKVRRMLERDRSLRHAVDELQQQVREKLFVGARKIGDYSGRGALEKWIEVVVLRTLIDASRQRHREPANDTLESGDGVPLDDPELQIIKERYRQQFKLAFQGAVERLTPDQRNLLKLHYVDGVTLERLATLMRLHCSTVAAHLAAARQGILDGAQRLLAEELKLAPAEIESLLRVMRSQLDISISRLLNTRQSKV